MAEIELGPSELDRLEDALEALEHEGALDRWLEDEPSPQVRERLADYRSILAVSREALPVEDVPVGVLDGVLEQARQAAAAAPVAAASEGTWWSRVRRTFMVPVLALAGTAALVLWVFDPADQGMLAEGPAGPGSAPTASSAAARAKDAQAKEEDARRREAPGAPAPSEAEAERAEQAPATAQPVTPADALDEGAADPAARAGAETKRNADEDAKPTPDAPATGSLGGVPGQAVGGGKAAETKQEPTGGAAGPASGRWDLVSRGDRARQAGDCVAAREEYALALEDDEARVRARAFAGLGLCDAQSGDEASADANYERARELDGEIGRFIDSQQRRSRPSSKRKSSPKKSKVSPSQNALDDVLDPYSP